MDFLNFQISSMVSLFSQIKTLVFEIKPSFPYISHLDFNEFLLKTFPFKPPPQDLFLFKTQKKKKNLKSHPTQMSDDHNKAKQQDRTSPLFYLLTPF